MLIMLYYCNIKVIIILTYAMHASTMCVYIYIYIYTHNEFTSRKTILPSNNNNSTNNKH